MLSAGSISCHVTATSKPGASSVSQSVRSTFCCATHRQSLFSSHRPTPPLPGQGRKEKKKLTLTILHLNFLLKNSSTSPSARLPNSPLRALASSAGVSGITLCAFCIAFLLAPRILVVPTNPGLRTHSSTSPSGAPRKAYTESDPASRNSWTWMSRLYCRLSAKSGAPVVAMPRFRLGLRSSGDWRGEAWGP